MKTKYLSALATLALLVPVLTAAHPVHAANHNPDVVLSLNELDSASAAQVAQATTPVVLEFYDPSDPDTSGECARQVGTTSATAGKFAGKVTLLRLDSQLQNQNMLQRDRIAVCPTHLFVFQKSGNTLYAVRIWGYLSEAQFEELFQQFYGISP